jgi:hypothetical protein
MGGCSYTGNSGGATLTDTSTEICARLNAGSVSASSKGSQIKRRDFFMM